MLTARPDKPIFGSQYNYLNLKGFEIQFTTFPLNPTWLQSKDVLSKSLEAILRFAQMGSSHYCLCVSLRLFRFQTKCLDASLGKDDCT